jgi:hypothetical protein
MDFVLTSRLPAVAPVERPIGMDQQVVLNKQHPRQVRQPIDVRPSQLAGLPAALHRLQSSKGALGPLVRRRLNWAAEITMIEVPAAPALLQLARLRL